MALLSQANSQKDIKNFRVDGFSPTAVVGFPRKNEIAITNDGNYWEYIGIEPSGQAEGAFSSAKKNPSNWRLLNETPSNIPLVQNVGEGNGEIYRDTTGDTINLRTITNGNNGIEVDTVGDEVVITSAIRIVVACGDVYFVATVDGFGDVSVKASAFIPDGEGELSTVPSYMLFNDGTFNITAFNLLVGIPENATSYSLSSDSGMTWTTPNADPNLAVITLECSDFTNNEANVLLTVTYSECAPNTSAAIPVSTQSSAPTCVNGLTFTLQPDGMGGGAIELYGQYFEASPVSSPFGPFTWSISKDGIDYFPSVFFTCDDLEGQQSAQFTIYIGLTNCAGAFDNCVSEVLINDNMGICNP